MATRSGDCAAIAKTQGATVSKLEIARDGCGRDVRRDVDMAVCGERLLEPGMTGLPMQERLLRAAEQVESGRTHVASSLRPEQLPVVASFEELLLDLVTTQSPDDSSPFWRIVLPPRTGKTVVAAHIIARTNLTAMFIVPTRILVRQVAEEMKKHLPGVPVGLLHGNEDSLVAGGVNIATYQILQSRLRKEELPAAVRTPALIFVDEAHHAMTPARMSLLSRAFDGRALRVALTATPDYDCDRQLRHHFPTRVAEVRITEAMRLGLLAPARVWVAEVNADGSTVRLLAGDYDTESLGRIMSSAPFFRAAQLFRYDPRNADMPALICCVSRQQARDLIQYLRTHRPADAPLPQLILGDTPPPKRRRILERFERGQVDTLVQVGVLIEGWNSPRCKLLIDLAPSRSRVRATQKYFRVMTPHGNREAHIYVLLPRDLPELPVLPPDILGAFFGGYASGSLIGPSNSKFSPPVQISIPVAGVRVKKRVLLSCSLEPPRLSRDDLPALRQVLRTCPDLDPTCGQRQFRRLLFQHQEFSGSGAFLLEQLRVQDFDSWMARVYPEMVADRLLNEGKAPMPCDGDPHELEQALLTAGAPPEAWRAVGGYFDAFAASPEDLAIKREERDLLLVLIGKLRPRQREILQQRYGLDGSSPMTWDQIATFWDRSRERIRQIAAHGIRKLRLHWSGRYHEGSRSMLSVDDRVKLGSQRQGPGHRR